MASPKKNANKEKALETSKLLVQKQKRPPPVNLRAFLDASRLSNYNHYFLKRPIAVEWHLDEKTILDQLMGYEV